MAALLLSGHAEVWHLAVLEAVNGAAFALFYPADTAVVPLTVGQPRSIQLVDEVMRGNRMLALVAQRGDAETPGPIKENKLTPRIRDTAKALWIVYASVTVACILALRAAGMGC